MEYLVAMLHWILVMRSKDNSAGDYPIAGTMQHLLINTSIRINVYSSKQPSRSVSEPIGYLQAGQKLRYMASHLLRLIVHIIAVPAHSP